MLRQTKNTLFSSFSFVRPLRLSPIVRNYDLHLSSLGPSTRSSMLWETNTTHGGPEAQFEANGNLVDSNNCAL
jgi:hypothetical protein